MIIHAELIFREFLVAFKVLYLLSILL